MGAHINAAGSSIKSARELDTTAVMMSRLFVDRRESTLNEAGDSVLPKQEGAIDDDHIVGEIGGILLAVEDLAAAHHIYRRALDRGGGVRSEFG